MKKKIEDIDINTIKDPEVIKCLNSKQLEKLASDIRQEIIDCTSKVGGHLSSNLGVVELTIALMRVFDFKKDKMIFDVGHQAYTWKILTGRSLKNLNFLNGISGFQKREESPYDVYEAGHAGTSLSAALAFATARDLKKEDYQVIALIGDASIVNGLAFEALNDIGNGKHHLICILNDNGMSISRPVGGLTKLFRGIGTTESYNNFKKRYHRFLTRYKFGRKLYSASYRFKTFLKSKLVPVNLFDNLGFSYIGPLNGHDIAGVEKALKKAMKTTKPALVHLLTQKGRGYRLTEEDSDGYWHSVTPFSPENGQPLNLHPGLESWSHFYGDEVYEALGRNDKLLLVCPAMKKGSHLEKAFETYPERCFDVGIAEEHALTFAGALSLNGFHPIVSIYSTFLQRAYDELLHDCSRMKTDMTLLIDRAGFVGANGETHQGLYDEAFLASIPNVTLAMPSTIEAAHSAFLESLKPGHGVFAIRYPHSLIEIPKTLNEEIAFIPGKWLFLNKFDEKLPTVIAVGDKGRKLLSSLKEDGLLFNQIDPFYLYPLDENSLKVVMKSPSIIIYDADGTINGFHNLISSYLLTHGYRGKFLGIAVPNLFVQHAKIEEQERICGVDIESSKKKILAFLKD